MKAISSLLIFILVLASGRAVAGEPIQRSCVFKNYSPSNDSLDHVRYMKSQAHWKKVKTTGTILTSVGGSLAVVGLAGMYGSIALDINKDISSWQDPLWVAGATVTSAALALLIPGVVMLVKGTRRYHPVRAGHKNSDFNGITL